MKTYAETLETDKQRKPLTYLGILKTHKKNAYVKTLKTEKLLNYMETLKTEKQRKPLTFHKVNTEKRIHNFATDGP